MVCSSGTSCVLKWWNKLHTQVHVERWSCRRGVESVEVSTIPILTSGFNVVSSVCPTSGPLRRLGHHWPSSNTGVSKKLMQGHSLPLLLLLPWRNEGITGEAHTAKIPIRRSYRPGKLVLVTQSLRRYEGGKQPPTTT